VTVVVAFTVNVSSTATKLVVGIVRGSSAMLSDHAVHGAVLPPGLSECHGLSMQRGIVVLDPTVMAAAAECSVSMEGRGTCGYADGGQSQLRFVEGHSQVVERGGRSR
jgi:hypothetical protein